MPYTVRHTIETDVATLWRLFFDQELARAMIREFGNAGSFEVVEERTDERGRLHRRIEVKSHVQLPSFLQKLVGDGGYTEIGTFDRALGKYSAECIPSLGADKFKTKFEVTARPIGDGARCEREITCENSVKVFGIGGMLEGLMEKVQREAHEQSAGFINNWLRANSNAPS
jgi:hypothetical protein